MKLKKLLVKNQCEKCRYYIQENKTCQSKKCATGGEGYVTLIDRIFCEPYIGKKEEKQ